jgi:hypothetical protein
MVINQGGIGGNRQWPCFGRVHMSVVDDDHPSGQERGVRLGQELFILRAIPVVQHVGEQVDVKVITPASL